MEGDGKVESFELDHFSFQSTPSAWRETCRRHGGLDKVEFQSTPSAWRETIRRCNRIQPGIFQSTPSAWRETTTDYRRCRYNVISIHSLRMEGDDGFKMKKHLEPLFQSTPSAWRETQRLNDLRQCINYFNPLPPHGGRQVTLHVQNHTRLFQSTPSAWRETYLKNFRPVIIAISIHSLRMEGDRC